MILKQILFILEVQRKDIKKDFKEEDQDDFEVLLDTFGDRRNGYVFITNILGAKADRQVANEGREINTSWDAVWSVKTRVVDDGWIVEMAIPLRSLRFDPAAGHAWGINFSRRIRRKHRRLSTTAVTLPRPTCWRREPGKRPAKRCSRGSSPF